MSQTHRGEAPLLSAAERDAFLARVRTGVSPEDYGLIEAMSYALPQIVASIEQERMTMRKLRHLLFGAKTEQTDRVCPSASSPSLIFPVPKSKRQGHGRLKATDYTGARWVEVPHPAVKPACLCPLCAKGAVRMQKTKAIVLRIEGAPPIAATGYRMERLRCDACGAAFTAPVPAAAGQEKYAPSVGVTIAVLRYGTGVPHYRLARLQQSLGVPLPASTQWELMAPLRELAQPIFAALVVLAANAPLLHHDDTTMRILDLRRPGSATAEELARLAPHRKGTFTSNVLAEVASHPVALYFTGWQHAGENLAAVLQQRATDLAPPIQMCDALSRNMSPESNTILAFCLSHGRREFVSVAPSFPDECRHVLDALGEVYRFDAEAKELGLKPEPRLAHHQTHSQPVMARLKAWLREKIVGKHVEPNSGLGQAMGYMLKHWEPLTLFLRQAGAPLDNNRCEQALKMAILHRKNSLSYKTLNGAQTGDLFMSLIHTCRLNRINPFAYLLAIATHAKEVKARPSAWLPWNYPQTEIPTELDHDPPGCPA
jgi:transposase